MDINKDSKLDSKLDSRSISCPVYFVSCLFRISCLQSSNPRLISLRKSVYMPDKLLLFLLHNSFIAIIR
jgi:hypothetical protein